MITKTQPNVNTQVKYQSTRGLASYGATPEEAREKAISDAKSRAWYTTQSFTVLTNGGTITYDVGRQKFNYCLHTSKDIEVSKSERIRTSLPIPYQNKYSCIGVREYGPSMLPPTPLAPSYDGEITEDRRARAWAALYPDLNTGFSLANFIWELAEFPLLIGQFSKWARILKTLNSDVFSTKTAAEMALVYAFALAPLKNDIEDMINLLKGVNKHVNDFIANGKKLQSYHYTEEISAAESLYYTRPSSSIWYGTRSTYHATLKCKYEYVNPGFWSNFRRLWGLRVTPEVVWNAIPFSFVIDWVCKISDFLRQFDRDPNVKVIIHDYCDSIKKEAYYREIHDASRGTLFNAPNTWTLNEGDGSEIYRHTGKLYHRVPGLPNTGFSLPASDELSARELVLGGALLRVQ